ncbi:glycoprotein 3-alpha-L-fucosyltransferase A-like isoform X2 [Biomphalaria glabrata]|uniref:Fucosyltransferase n=1 Tax=Biomphalaria glabrata TaxID=6526 RepID=A0A9W3BNA9_BIOGL|nr:glycoprotein 3-alpha-L-fucosyltransferase A-like isoform X2 [Biomphalaria glabrata]
MRFHLKKTIQVVVVIGCVLVYINVYLSTKSFWTLNWTSEPNQRAPRKNDVPSTTRESLHPEVYPNTEHYTDDRIVSQLNFVPPSLSRQLQSGASSVKLRKILLYNGIGGWDIKRGQETFLDQKCKVPYCEITESKSDMQDAHVVLFQGPPRAGGNKPPHQNWLVFLLESPYHTPGLGSANGLVNWTASYRHDSTIVAPYEKFVAYNTSRLTQPQQKNYAAGKTKMVAWFVSNCGARNGRRQYADELAKYIQVDIYGGCGPLQCPRHESNKCFDMLNNDYKFYLSFENSNCRDYITEKFFINGLKHDVIPIVMGAAPEDYVRAAPPHSFIHVDEFESPKHLADYLHLLDKDDKLYNEYFQWKGTGDIINTFFWCRVCALAHDDDRGQSWYNDVEAWWRNSEVCIGTDNWRNRTKPNQLIADMPIVIPRK